MRPHPAVHRRREQHRPRVRRIERAQEIVGHAPGELRQDVGGRRRDEQQVRVPHKRDVLDIPSGGEVELPGKHRLAGQGLECQRSDEFPGMLGHDRRHLRSRAPQAAHDLRGLVGRDPARDAEDDARRWPGPLPGPSAGRPRPSPLGARRCLGPLPGPSAGRPRPSPLAAKRNHVFASSKVARISCAASSIREVLRRSEMTTDRTSSAA